MSITSKLSSLASSVSQCVLVLKQAVEWDRRRDAHRINARSLYGCRLLCSLAALGFKHYGHSCVGGAAPFASRNGSHKRLAWLTNPASTICLLMISSRTLGFLAFGVGWMVFTPCRRQDRLQAKRSILSFPYRNDPDRDTCHCFHNNRLVYVLR